MMTRIFVYIATILFAAVTLVGTASEHNVGAKLKVLVVFPFPGKSHSILGNGVVQHLLDAGHEVTYITPFPKTKKQPNLHQIDVSNNLQLIPADMVNIKNKMEKGFSAGDVAHFISILTSINTHTLANVQMKSMLADPGVSFDVIIAEYMFSEFFIGLSAVYGCPFIWLSTVEPHWAILSLIDEATNPAYVPNAMSSAVTPFSFGQRIKELLFQAAGYFFNNVLLYSKDKATYEELLVPIIKKKGREVPTFSELRFNSSLVLGNSHPILGQATTLPQSYIPIAGYHIDFKVEPLPEDLQKLMDNAKNGVIYFSMGSNLKSKDLPDEIKQNLLKMFSRLKLTVLWKFEETLPNLPSNVHIVQWAPQLAILAHPNCRLFITHGGLLSTIETLQFGVPIVGIPVFADQFNNVARAVNKGFAKKVTLSYEMTEELEQAITDVLNDPKYSSRAKELSAVFMDRVKRPGEVLTHAVQHVVVTRGALHLRSPALLVPLYQKLYLDAAALLLVILIGLRALTKMLYRRIQRLWNADKKNK